MDAATRTNVAVCIHVAFIYQLSTACYACIVDTGIACVLVLDVRTYIKYRCMLYTSLLVYISSTGCYSSTAVWMVAYDHPYNDAMSVAAHC